MSEGISLFSFFLGILSSLSCKKKKRNSRIKDELHEQQTGGEQVGTEIYSKTTAPPAASRAAFNFSASSLDTLARISWGRDSTSFLAWYEKDGEKKTKQNKI